MDVFHVSLLMVSGCESFITQITLEWFDNTVFKCVRFYFVFFVCAICTIKNITFELPNSFVNGFHVKTILVLCCVRLFTNITRKRILFTSALCSPPNVKSSIRDLSQISTTALIFMKTNYFRQDIWIKIWTQFHFQYIFEGWDDFIHTRHIIVPPEIDYCKLDPSKNIKHVGTSWTLFCKRQLRFFGRNNLQGKYFIF